MQTTDGYLEGCHFLYLYNHKRVFIHQCWLWWWHKKQEQVMWRKWKTFHFTLTMETGLHRWANPSFILSAYQQTPHQQVCRVKQVDWFDLVGSGSIGLDLEFRFGLSAKWRFLSLDDEVKGQHLVSLRMPVLGADRACSWTPYGWHRQAHLFWLQEQPLLIHLHIHPSTSSSASLCSSIQHDKHHIPLTT